MSEPIVNECVGCKRIKDGGCIAYLNPAIKWRNDWHCPLATHIVKAVQTALQKRVEQRKFAGKGNEIMLRYGAVGCRFGPKVTNPSQTPGKTKGKHCMATVLQRFFAKRSRACRHPKYGEWCLWADKKNKSKSVKRR